MKSAIACSLAFLMAAAGARGQSSWEIQFQERLAARSQPATELPTLLKATPGKMSLLTDFKPGADGEREVYLVNLTDKPFELDHQFRPMLERLTQSGWERAEYYREEMVCVGVLMGKLGPGRMIKMRGYQPRSGQPSTIRYRLYHSSMTAAEEIVTGLGGGLVSLEEVALASRDGWCLRTCSLERVIQIATAEVTFERHPLLIEPQFLRELAVVKLGWGNFPVARVKPVLESLLRDPDHGISGSARSSLIVLRMIEMDAAEKR
jgi:hypothetical protein